MGGMSIGNLPSQSILKKINDIAADVNDLDLEGVNNLKSKLSNLVAPELGNSDEKAISQKIVTENIQRLNTEVNNKISKVESAQTGNLPVFDNGNVRDSKIPSDNIAQQNGYYESMVVGASRSLAGDNEVRAEYVFRPSGGTDIQSGTASINRVLGKTLVWNQLVKNGNFTDNPNTDALPNDWVNGSWGITGIATISYPIEGGIKIVCDKKTSSNNVGFRVSSFIGMTANRKYKLSFEYSLLLPENVTTPNDYVAIGGTLNNYQRKKISATNGAKTQYNKIVTFSENVSDFQIQFMKGIVLGEELWINNIQLFDLTQMFGEGNEPSSVEEFEAMFPNTYYEYNEGTLISNDAVGIKSVGFNAWDEEWEVGFINSKGDNEVKTNSIRSNYIKVLPNTKYYIATTNPAYDTGESIRIRFYDNNKNHIGNPTIYRPNKLFITPDGCCYMKWCTYPDTIPTDSYSKGDICINLSNSGIRDGEYEPYEEHKLLFNKGNKLSAIKGKLNGEGESVVVFPDGLRSAGSVRDEIVGNVAIKRIGAVDMGTLNWSTISDIGFYAKVPNKSLAKGDGGQMSNLITNKYPSGKKTWYSSINGDKTVCELLTTDTLDFIKITDSKYTNNIADFRQSLQGQILYYELAEPETYILDEAVPMNYVVNDWGTEQRLVADENEVLTPLCYDVTYAINAVDTIRNMPKNYISEETMQAFLSAVGSAMGGTWSMTWNEDMQKYVFTFAPNAVATDVE